MQELRSTDIIDKEIHSDAVRKVERILKKAKSDSEALLNSLDDAVAKDQADKKDFYAKKLAAFEKDQNASIPLEKQRFQVSFVQSKIESSINVYLEGLSEEKKLEIASSAFDFNVEQKVNAYYYGFSKAAVQKFLDKKLGKKLLNLEETQFGKIILEDSCGLKKPEGIILEAEDKSFRCRLTLSQVFGNIIDRNRAELSEALFGVI